MAFNADILLKVDSTAAERQVKKLERSISKVEDATRDILAVDKQIVRERKALLRLSGEQATNSRKRIQALSVQKAQLSLQKRELSAIVRLEKQRSASNNRIVGASAGADGGGGADASGFALGSALGNAQKFRDEVQKIRTSLIESTEDGRAFTKALDESIAVTSKLNDNSSRQAANQSKIEDFTRRVAVQEGQVKRLRGKSGVELDKAKRLLGETKNELKSTTASQRGLVTAAERYNAQLAESERRLSGIDGKLQKAAKKQVGAARNSRLPQAALAGAAFANVPGQDIAQAAGAGALIAGPKGAAVAAVVASLAKLASLAPGLAKTIAELARMEIALSNVAGVNLDKALGAIEGTVRDFNTPVVDATTNFTRLLAASKSAGFSLNETETVFRGLSAANKALGGDSEKLSGILLATTQVFSKGKVAAEELRGQIGERLPGAFSKFAAATGRSTKELDKALEQGEVSLNDFVKFAESLLNEYEQDAKKIADGPEEAGARLQTALTDLNRAIGPIFADLGSKFQDFATEAIKALTPLGERLREIFDLGTVATRLDDKIKQILELNQAIFDVSTKLQKVDNNVARRALEEDLKSLTNRRDILQEQADKLRENLTPKAAASAPEDQVKGRVEQIDSGAVDDLEKRLRLAKQITITDQELFDLEVQRALATAAGNEALARRISGIQDEVQERMNLFTQLENENNELLQQELINQSVLKIERIRLGVAEDLLGILRDINDEVQQEFLDFFKADQSMNSALDQAQEEFNEFYKEATKVNRKLEEDIYQRIGRAIEDSIVGGIEAAITGAEKLSDVLTDIASNLLRDVGRMFINAGISGLGAGLKLPGYADGGTIPIGTTAIVGEAGPEIVHTTPNGTEVISNDKAFSDSAAALRVTGPKNNFSDSSDMDTAFADSRAAMNASSMNAINNLNSTSNSTAMVEGVPESTTTTIRYESQIINEVKYVTEEQAMKIGQMSAKQAEANVYRGMKNKPATRSRAGLK